MAAARKTKSAGKSYEVIVAGGGFTGGALALALAKLGPKNLRVALVDAAPRNADQPKDARGLALSAATMRLLDAVGVWPQLASNAQAITSIDITDSPLNASLRPHFLGFDEEMKTHEPSACLVEAGDLLHAISTAVASQKTIDVFAADSVEACETDAFCLRATLASGKTLQAPLLVAADGKRSKVRERAGIKTIGWSYPQVGIVATVAHDSPHNGTAVQHFLPAGPFAMLPLKGNRSSIVWTEEEAKGDALMAANDEAFTAELTRRFGHRLGAITLEGPRQSFPLTFQIARGFVADRIALIGDAAHVVHPLAGQGLNIGVRDVAALTEIIVEALRLGLDIGSAPVLERYQRWRRFDSAFSGTVMDALNRLFSNDSAPLRAIRDLGLGLVDRAPTLKRFLVREAAGGTGNVPRLLKGEAL
ncbi:MAG: FAD-dependent monooxygenase [Hyphomicrobiales bacterium]